MRLIYIFLFILLQIPGIPPSYAQNKTDSLVVQYDASSVQVRHIPQQKIADYQADSDFDYGYDVAEGISIWQRIRYWLARLWQTLFGESISGNIIEFAFYVLCLAGLVYVILRLLEVDATRLFYRKEKGSNLAFQEGIHDNIHSISFEEEIQKALEEKDYRKAIRLRYLFALKQLADQEVIRWQVGKTNAEYLQEVPIAFQAALYDLNYYYTYTWYGNFPANESLYQHVEKNFNLLSQAVMAKV
jgi:hypothetical protein